MGASRYNTYVLGHLDKDDARRFWDELLSQEVKTYDKKVAAPPDFEYAYDVCGGSMYLLDLFMHEFFEYPDGLIHSDNGCFSATLQKERRLMVKAMHSQKSPKMN